MKNLCNIARCLKFLSDARKGKHKAHGSDEFYVPDECLYTDEVLYVNSGTIPAKAYKGNLNIKKVIIGKDVKAIGAEAFSGCFYIENFVVEAENPYFADYDSNAIIEKESGVLIAGCHTTVIPECVTEIPARRSPVAFCPISLLTLNRSRDRESLRSGKHNRKLRKRKRARSRDLAPKQHQYDKSIVKTNPNQFRLTKQFGFVTFGAPYYLGRLPKGAIFV